MFNRFRSHSAPSSRPSGAVSGRSASSSRSVLSWRSVSSLLLALVLALTLAACDSGGGMEEPEPEPEPEPQNQEPTASFSVSPGTNVTAGTQVTLDASASSDPDGDALTFEWALSGPSGSTASLSSTSSETPTFTADVGGDFEIGLTVRDGNGGSDNAEEVLTATSAVITIDSDITTDETWAPPNIYRVTTNVGIVGATLTIEPGTRVEFEANASLEVDDDNAALIANGTSDDGILMTGTQQNAGFWGGIVFFGDNANNLVNFTTIEYAGGVSFSQGGTGAVVLGPNGNVSLTNTTIQDSDDAAVRASDAAIGFLAFEANTFDGNNGPAVVLPAYLMGAPDGSSTYIANVGDYVEITPTSTTTDIVANALPVPYRMTGLTLIEDGTLRIEQGAVLEFAADAGIDVGGTGTTTETPGLLIDGAPGDRVTLTGVSETSGSWRGIGIYVDTPDTQINYADISYAGGDTFFAIGEQANVAVWSEAAVSINNSSVTDSDGYGVYLNGSAKLAAFETNSFSGNTLAPLSIPASQIGVPDETSTFVTDQNPYVQVRYGVVSDAQTVSPLDVPYRVSNQIFVGENGAFTIDAGTTMEFTSTGEIYVGNNNASFVVDGTSADPVTLTGVQTPTDGGSWPGIGIESSNADNRISNAVIAYGGTELVAFTDNAANIGLALGARLLIEDSEVNFSGDYGIWVNQNENVQLTVNNVSFTGNDTGNQN